MPNIFYHLTVADNLRVAQQGKTPLGQLLFKGRGSGQSEQLTEMLEIIGSQDKRDFLASSLSHGEKQWLEICMVLVNRPSRYQVTPRAKRTVGRVRAGSFQSSVDRINLDILRCGGMCIDPVEGNVLLPTCWRRCMILITVSIRGTERE